MPIARERSNAWAPSPAALRIAFFSERAAEFYETAVDYLLGWDLITEREFAQVTVFDVDDDELRADLLEAALRMGGDEITALQ